MSFKKNARSLASGKSMSLETWSPWFWPRAQHPRGINLNPEVSSRHTTEWTTTHPDESLIRCVDVTRPAKLIFRQQRGTRGGTLSRSPKSADPEYFNGQLSGRAVDTREYLYRPPASCALIKTLTRYILEMKLVRARFDTDRKLQYIHSDVIKELMERWNTYRQGSNKNKKTKKFSRLGREKEKQKYKIIIE